MNVKGTDQFKTKEAVLLFQFENGNRSTKEQLPEAVEAQIKLHNQRFSGKGMECLEIPHLENDEIVYYIIGGLGDGTFNYLKVQKTMGKAVKSLLKLKVKNAVMLVDGLEDDFARIAAETSLLAQYTFDLYKTDAKPSKLETVEVYPLTEAVKEGLVLGQATLDARTLVNEPANVMIPIELAARAVKAGEESGFDVHVLDEKEIQALDMKAYWEVAKSSDNVPRFIIMTHKGNPDSDEILGLVGKGLTFDTGGYSLKSKEGMLTMKSDMGGSAAVIGAMSAIAKMNLKVNVTAVVAACENMLSGGSYRPGDIIGSRGGKTIFIKSTDAEGRLTLVDAVDYIIKDLKATKVVDIATLTGACVMAFGKTTTGIVSNNDAFYGVLEKSSELSGEKVWRMPMFPEYKELIKHKEADLTNATRMAGMITAGMFIGEFVGDLPWIHMDIAGTSWTEGGNEYQSYGGTGAGVKNLYYIAKQQ